MKGIKWFFAEFLVVVTGVLVAFSLNSWWMDLKDDRKEEAYLAQVFEDIETSVELLEGAVEFQTASVYSTSELLKAIYMKEIPPDSVLNPHALRSMSFEPGGLIQSTLLSLVNSGDLQMISSDSVRMELTVLSGELITYENMRETIAAQMFYPGFKELSAVLSPLDIGFSSLSEANYQLAHGDTLVPLPEFEEFKRPEQVDWASLMSNGTIKDELTYIYFAHVNLRRAHQGALRYLKDSKANLDAYLKK